MRVLVTGAGGYIGVPLCRRLLQDGHAVVGLDRYFFGLDKVEELRHEKGFTVLQDDIRQFDTSILTDCDAVVDLAGLSNDATAEIDPRLTIDINFRGAVRCATAAKEHGVRRYVYSSSASVYGRGASLALDEESPLNPQTEYARTKVAVEQAILPMADSRFTVTALRNSTVYGLAPRMRFDLVINVITMRAWRERVIYIMGGGEQWRPLIHVADVVEAMVAALGAPAEKVNGQIFNVGSDDQNYQVQQIARFVVDVIPNVTIHRIPDDQDKRTYNVAFGKIGRVLDWKPTRRAHEGIVEIKQALDRGAVLHDDPTCFTLQWYTSLIAWSSRIRDLTCRGSVLELSEGL
jgi:nucleoside-diphosphate-sugar epimerase